MKVLVIAPAGDGLDDAIRYEQAGHTVKTYFNPHSGHIGDGMIDRVEEWEPWMRWADLIVITYNSKYAADFEPYFNKGYPIFGCNREGLRLESDRGFAMDVMEQCGIETPPFKVFNSIDKGLAYVRGRPKAYACKPLTDADRGLSYVAQSPEDLIYKLKEARKAKSLKHGFILQEKIDGVEMAVGGWIGPGGFSEFFNENWEEKRLMNDGLGINTGEQGTILRYTKHSQLATEVLLPLEDYLVGINYIGYVDVNCIIHDGQPMPLELTMRFGRPHFEISSTLHLGDDVKFMAALLEGRDTLRAKDGIACGVVVSHGDYPYGRWSEKELSGVPIYGIKASNAGRIKFVKVKMGLAPIWRGGKEEWIDMPVTAGDEVLVTTGHGETVEEARDKATNLAGDLHLPSNKMYRTDIGKRLEKDLKELHKHGYAGGMNYA